jgi:hypothetical protein
VSDAMIGARLGAYEITAKVGAAIPVDLLARIP